jgi:CO dehydrogenase/acetyl-CoA synthase alpha subunit
MNAFLNDIPVKVVVDTAAMITLVNEKLICGEEHGDEGLVKLRGLGEQLVYGRIGILIVSCSNIRATLVSVVWLATNLA